MSDLTWLQAKPLIDYAYENTIWALIKVAQQKGRGITWLHDGRAIPYTEVAL